METATLWHPVRSTTRSFEVPSPQIVTVDGADVVVRDGGGSGTPVVLVHGWCADGLLNFAPVFAPLAEAGWRPISVDLPGHGGTRDSQPVSILRCQEVVAAALSVLAVPPAVVLGYSLGGPVSQLLAKNHPDQVVALIEVATGARNLPNEVLRPSTVTLSALGGHGIRLGRRALRRGESGGPGNGDHHSLLSHAAWVARTAGYGDLCALGVELASFDSRSWVGSLGVPAHSIVTLNDHLVAPAVQYELADLLGAAVTTVHGGHAACVTGHFSRDVLDAVTSVEGHLKHR